VAVDIFGHPADFDAIMPLAKRHGITVIEDCAQSPGATLHGRNAGALADLGVFSLNYHKTIHTGEGGVVTSDSDRLANRIRLIRNHAETVVKDMGESDVVNMIGQNYRMTEIEAAIGSEQLKKLSSLLTPRQRCADFYRSQFSAFPFLKQPVVRPGVVHAWYVYVLRYDERITGVRREKVVAAIRAEGVPLAQGYVEPLYLQPMYQQRIASGAEGFPFHWRGWDSGRRYAKGLCPVAERMHEKELLQIGLCHASLREEDWADVANAFCKVFENLDELR
jgi:dTDP-4-amino-4,6-dideoxygalactose transaminase